MPNDHVSERGRSYLKDTERSRSETGPFVSQTERGRSVSLRPNDHDSERGRAYLKDTERPRFVRGLLMPMSL